MISMRETTNLLRPFVQYPAQAKQDRARHRGRFSVWRMIDALPWPKCLEQRLQNRTRPGGRGRARSGSQANRGFEVKGAMKHATRMALISGGYLGTVAIFASWANAGFALEAPAHLLIAFVLGQYVLFALAGYFFLGKFAPSMFQRFFFNLPYQERIQTLGRVSKLQLMLLGLDRSGNKLP